MWYPFINKFYYSINMPLNLKIFLDIIVFSKGPQDLPSSSRLLNLVMLANLLVALISFIPQTIVAMNILNALIFIIVTSLFIKAALNIREKSGDNKDYSSRYIQVCTSTLGIHVIFVLIQGILIMLFSNGNEITETEIPTNVAIIFLVVSLYAWFVNGHIFKNALDTTMIAGLGISLLHGLSIIFVTLIILQAVA